MSVQGLGSQYNAARPQQFGAQKPQKGAPKFGYIPVACECAVACCAAPIAIPLIGVALFKLIGKLKELGAGIAGLPGRLRKGKKTEAG